MSNTQRRPHVDGLAAIMAGLVLMGMPSAVLRSRDHSIQRARLAGAALERKAAS